MKFAKICIILVICKSLLFSTDNPKKIFLNSQSEINRYYLYKNYSSDDIQTGFIYPIYETKLPWEKADRYFHKWHQIPDLFTYWRIHPTFSFGETQRGIRQIIKGTITLELIPDVIIQNDFEFDSDGYDDPHFRGILPESTGKWTGYLQHSSLTWFNQWGHVFLGRTNLSFTNTGESVLLNFYFPPSETVWWHVKRGKLQLDGAIVFLDSINQKNRIMTFGRYGYQTSQFQIGFTEMVLLSYNELSAEEIRYLLPSSVLFETEINGGKNSNLMWMLDLVLKLGNNTITGEMLVDDFAIDGKSPPKLAGKIGWWHNFDGFITKIQYIRINRWVGNYFDPELRFQSNGVLMGHPMGPDGHRVDLSAFWKVTESLFIVTDISWEEKGIGNINDWPEDIGNSSNFGWSSEKHFPSHPLTSKYSGIISIDYFVSDWIKITHQIEYSTAYSPDYKLEIGFTL